MKHLYRLPNDGKEDGVVFSLLIDKYFLYSAVFYTQLAVILSGVQYDKLYLPK